MSISFCSFSRCCFSKHALLSSSPFWPNLFLSLDCSNSHQMLRGCKSNSIALLSTWDWMDPVCKPHRAKLYSKNSGLVSSNDALRLQIGTWSLCSFISGLVILPLKMIQPSSRLVLSSNPETLTSLTDLGDPFGGSDPTLLDQEGESSVDRLSYGYSSYFWHVKSLTKVDPCQVEAPAPRPGRALWTMISEL